MDTQTTARPLIVAIDLEATPHFIGTKSVLPTSVMSLLIAINHKRYILIFQGSGSNF